MKISKVAGLLLAGAAAAWLIGSAPASAAKIIGTEDPVHGFTGNFLTTFPDAVYLVASDGESSFDPFGAGYDTSDGLNFSGVGFVWNQASDSSWNSLGNQTWVLPANLSSIGCGTENGTTCEPYGHFISSSAWNPLAIGTWDIMEADGSLSDVIVTANTANGAELWFYSDPSLIPEPITLAVFGAGLAGAAALRRRKKAVA